MRLPGITWRKVGMTSNHHAPYDLDYTRATMGGATSCDSVSGAAAYTVRPEYLDRFCVFRPLSLNILTVSV